MSKSEQDHLINELKTKIDFYKNTIAEVKKYNTVLNDLLHEKNKKVMELNQKIEYLLQEQKYEILELFKSDEEIENIKQLLKENSQNKGSDIGQNNE